MLGRPHVVLDHREHDEFAWLTPARASALELSRHIRETLGQDRIR